MSSVQKNKDFLRVLLKHKKTPGEIKKLMDIATHGEIDACCEVYLNALKGNIHLTPRIARLLHKHRKQCEQLINKKTGLSKKRKILKGQVGGFLPAILGLAAPLLGTLVGAITGRR